MCRRGSPRANAARRRRTRPPTAPPASLARTASPTRSAVRVPTVKSRASSRRRAGAPSVSCVVTERLVAPQPTTTGARVAFLPGGGRPFSAPCGPHLTSCRTSPWLVAGTFSRSLQQSRSGLLQRPTQYVHPELGFRHSSCRSQEALGATGVRSCSPMTGVACGRGGVAVARLSSPCALCACSSFADLCGVDGLRAHSCTGTVSGSVYLRSMGVTVWDFGHIYRGPFAHRYWSSKSCVALASEARMRPTRRHCDREAGSIRLASLRRVRTPQRTCTSTHLLARSQMPVPSCVPRGLPRDQGALQCPHRNDHRARHVWPPVQGAWGCTHGGL